VLLSTHSHLAPHSLRPPYTLPNSSPLHSTPLYSPLPSSLLSSPLLSSPLLHSTTMSAYSATDSESDSILKIAKLTSENYHTWRVQIEDTLGAKRLWEYVSGDYPIPTFTLTDGVKLTTEQQDKIRTWKREDKAAVSYIRRSIDDSLLHGLPTGGEVTSKVLWEYIKDKFQASTKNAQIRVWTQISSAQYDETTTTMSAHISFFEECRKKLAHSKLPIPDEILTMMMIKSLPASYEPLKVQLNGINDDNFTFIEVSRRLLDHEQRRLTDTAGTASNPIALSVSSTPKNNRQHSSSSPNGNGRNRSRGRDNDIRCHYCGYRGHYEASCRKKKDQVGDSSANFTTESIAFIETVLDPSVCDDFTRHKDTALSAVLTGPANSQQWFIDSGASKHYCRDRTYFHTYTDVQLTVRVGDNRFIPVIGLGTVRVVAPTGNGTTRNITLINVHHAPALAVNLLSVGGMTATGNTVMFKPTGECVVLDSTDEVLAVTRKMQDSGLYPITIQLQSAALAVRSTLPTPSSTDPVTPPTAKIWHARSGHSNINSLVTLFERHMVQGVKCNTVAASIKKSLPQFTLSPCEPCVEGKSHRQPFPSTGATRATAPLQLVHTDIDGPLPHTSLGGARYAIVIVDDFTRFTWVRQLNRKDDAAQAIKDFTMWAETQHQQNGYTLRVIRSDNGGEFVNNALSSWFKERGTDHQLTVPYTPQQNGVAERMNRTLMEMVRTVLLSARLSPPFWAQALLYAAHTRNRLITKAVDGMTPHEAWTGTKPDISTLRPFGCVAYVHIPSALRNKLDPKARKCMMVGYPPNAKGWLLWDSVGHKLIVARDVVFHEYQLWSSTAAIGREGRGGPGTNYSSLTFTPPSNDDIPTYTTPVTKPSVDLAPQPNDGNNAGNAVVDDDDETEVTLHPQLKMLTDFLGSGPADAAPSVLGSRNGKRGHVALLVDGELCAMVAMDKPNDDRPESDTIIPQSAVTTNNTPVEPRSYSEACSRSDSNEWLAACSEEVAALKRNDTYELVDRVPGMNVVRNRWVFKHKRLSDFTHKYKARLVAKGFTQKEGVDYDETFSPVVRFDSLRCLLALAAHYDWEVHHMDVKTAYLNGILDKDIYMEQPEGFVVAGKEDKVCRLKKGLYGLKQAGRAWHETIDPALRRLGLTPLNSDSCVYLYRQKDNLLILSLYVDDLFLFTNSTTLLKQYKQHLQSLFRMEDLGEVKLMLGIEVNRDRKRRTLTISQTRYINDTLARLDAAEYKVARTPMVPGTHLRKASESYTPSPKSVTAYQSAIGALMYAAIATRPDIAYTVSALSQHCSKPTEDHENAKKHLLRYLRGTVDVGITYSGLPWSYGVRHPPLAGFSDSDYANGEDRKSVTGYCYKLSGGAVTWSSRRQPTTAQSTVEAEYMALAEAVKEAIWLRRYLYELGYMDDKPIVIYGDNQGSINLSKNPEHHKLTKHIDTKYHLTREHTKLGTVNIIHTNTQENTADVLTKPLGPQAHAEHAHALGMSLA
jgi:transposase InsO family protein